MLIRKLLLQLLIFIIGGVVAIALEWFVLTPRPWLFISESSAIEKDSYLHLVVANYGTKPAQLLTGWAIIRFENPTCGRGSITIDYRTADVSGVYLGRFTQTSVALAIDSWNVDGLETDVEAIESSSACGSYKSKEILASSRLTCQIVLKGRYGEGTGSPAYHMGAELVPCALLVDQLVHNSHL